MFLKSQTWDELKLLLRELPPKRLRFLALVLLASLLQGLIDIFLVGLLARLVGLLAGAKLGDQIPGIRFFGGGMLRSGRLDCCSSDCGLLVGVWHSLWSGAPGIIADSRNSGPTW